MDRRLLLFFLLIIPLASSLAQSKESPHLLLRLMKREPTQFNYFLDHKTKLEIQIIYTQVNRDANNMPSFRSFYFNVDSTRYFYPASTVKLPMVLLALEKLQGLGFKGLDKYTPVYFDSVYSGQRSETRDTTSRTGYASIAHYAKKILVVSDNDAYNRLYEFMGQREANARLRDKGYTVRLLHRLDRYLTPDENRHTEAIHFVRNDTLFYSQPMLVNDSIPISRKVLKGVAYYRNDTLIRQPFDFSYKNFYPLVDQQRVLQAIVFPKSVNPKRRFNISEDDRHMVLKYMSQLPTETKYPAYNKDSTYFPAYCKYLLFAGDSSVIPANIRIFNKVGDAYGYLIDNAYVVDFENGVEFLLSAVIHANTDGIYNDGDYEYETIGYPFMKNLGQLIYQYELKRKRARKPDLSEFKFEYGE